MTTTPMRSDFGIKVTRLLPTLEPCIDGIATDIEEFTRSRALHSIEFNRLDHFSS
ncbi:hypothetical protein [Brasilonema bromeliae]|uniref:hypothetical protein n=1 Tax=Brasilonema bromeliae TaxID=383615 RepID=UPI00145F88AA